MWCILLLIWILQIGWSSAYHLHVGTRRSFAADSLSTTTSTPRGGSSTTSTSRGLFPRHSHSTPLINMRLYTPRSTVMTCSRRRTRLYLDVFGLGPSEAVFILLAGALLFGPDQVRDRLQTSKPKAVLEREKLPLAVQEMYSMMDYSEKERQRRALQRLNEAVDDNVDYVLQRIDAFERRNDPLDIDDDNDDIVDAEEEEEDIDEDEEKEDL